MPSISGVSRSSSTPLLALTQGDPAGVGPEIVLATALAADRSWRPLLVIERAAVEACAPRLADREDAAERLRWIEPDALGDATARRESGNAVLAIDPVGRRRTIEPGRSTAADAGGAMAALDVGAALARSGAADALVTAPLSKASIARHVDPSFRGHTDYLAHAAGLERYGRDYLMAFLSADLRVALLNTHLPLTEALDAVTSDSITEALGCLARHVDGSIAVPGINPHAGEGGLMGTEEGERIVPALDAARERGIDVHGPESPDSIFARARRGEFDWVLALYHDQGLIAVKTAAFGSATNWTLGLPFLRTSVDHGTAFDLAGTGRASAEPLAAVVATTLELVRQRRVSRASGS